MKKSLFLLAWFLRVANSAFIKNLLVGSNVCSMRNAFSPILFLFLAWKTFERDFQLNRFFRSLSKNEKKSFHKSTLSCWISFFSCFSSTHPLAWNSQNNLQFRQNKSPGQELFCCKHVTDYRCCKHIWENQMSVSTQNTHPVKNFNSTL